MDVRKLSDDIGQPARMIGVAPHPPSLGWCGWGCRVGPRTRSDPGLPAGASAA